MNEHTPRWHKSSHSEGATNCVEVAHLAGAVGVRDSKNLTGAQLALPRGAWSTFLADLAERTGR